MGLLRTTNEGADWQLIDGDGTLPRLNISGVSPFGAMIVVSANAADTYGNAGVWRSTDTGTTWKQISGLSGSGLPSGASFDLARDPVDFKTLFTNAGGNGIFRSQDHGATWTKVSNAAMDSLISGAGNVEMAVGRDRNVFAAIVRFGRLAGLFFSRDQGLNWASLDLPATLEAGTATVGIHPGGQGSIHLSISADLNKPHLCYVGGDRQVSVREVNPSLPSWPNSIGAKDYSGRLFRVDASAATGKQATPITHAGTASNSSPHADSRDMDFDVKGNLIEGDDGGVYLRSKPQSKTGDWFSVNGDLQSAEYHAVAWDSNAKIVIAGAQDTGTPQHQVPANRKWHSVTTGDGGVVAVDDSSAPGFSIRYSSYQRLLAFRRRVFNAANDLLAVTAPPLTVVGGGASLTPQFYTPIELNNIDATRMIIGGSNGVYESLDESDTIRAIGPGIRVNASGRNPIAYGGSGDEDALYVGAGSRVFIRTGSTTNPLAVSTAYPGTRIVEGVGLEVDNFKAAFVVDATTVFRTTDAGSNWDDVTGDLFDHKPGILRSVAFLSGAASPIVAVGTDRGVFVTKGPAFNKWIRFGKNLPNAPVVHLEYSTVDKVLLAGTLGRGAWTVKAP